MCPGVSSDIPLILSPRRIFKELNTTFGGEEEKKVKEKVSETSAELERRILERERNGKRMVSPRE